VAAADLLTFRPAGQDNHRVRIDGVVTSSPTKLDVFVRSEKTAIGLHFYAPETIAVGDRISVVGSILPRTP